MAGPLLARFVDQWVPKSADDLSLFGVGSRAGEAGATAAAQRRAPPGRRGGHRGRRGGGVARRHPGRRCVTEERGAGAAGDRDDVAGGGPRTDADGHFGSFDEPLAPGRKRVSFASAIIGITLPVVLMLVDAITKLTVTDEEQGVRKTMDFIGTPIVALLIAVLFCYVALGLGSGLNKSQVSDSVGSALPGIAGIILIVAAGGGFKQTLIDAGVGKVIKDWAEGVSISVLVLGWLVAVLIRLGTGSATVATITAAGIVGTARPDPVGEPPGAARAGHRLRVAVLLARQRRRLLAGQGVLRAHRRRDDQVVVGHGDRDLGVRLRAGDARQHPRHLAPDTPRRPTSCDLPTVSPRSGRENRAQVARGRGERVS